MRAGFPILVTIFVSFLMISCVQEVKKSQPKDQHTELTSKNGTKALVTEKPHNLATPKNMVWIPGKEFSKGAVKHDTMAMHHEKPAHMVAVDGFFIDETEVSNADFRKFVLATNYNTLAERAVVWEELKKQVPPGTPKPHDSLLQPGSLVFKKTKSSVSNLNDFSQWWEWKIGANWQHPQGPGSTIEGKDTHPVVHIAYEDAKAYCKWAGRRLATEAEWELAAKGKQQNTIFTWGNEVAHLAVSANTWDGEFPVANTKLDGYEGTAPIKSYRPNSNGLYDMAGNVWEWTSDWYNSDYYATAAISNGILSNPTGAKKSFNRSNPYAVEKVIKGGSFLCSDTYCANYRISARMGTSLDSSLEHLGFRTVATVAMLQNKKNTN